MQEKISSIQVLESLLQNNNYPSTSRNYATIQHVLPSNISKDEIFSKISKVALGVSLGSPMVLHNKFVAAIKLLNKFDDYCILMGDSIYQYTLQIQYGMNEEESVAYANKISKMTHAHHLQQLDKMNLSSSTKFIFMSEIEQHDSFMEIYEIIKSTYDTNRNFKKLFESFSDYYFSRVLSDQNIDKRCIELSHEYLLKELTVFSVLRKLNYSALVYPGHIMTIAEILSTEIKELNNIFQDLHFISIRIKR